MIDQLKHNTRIKLISLLSAIVLWMYVIAIVDPKETKVFEGLPIQISNMAEVKDKDLVIYPEVDLIADINITGKLSSLKKVSKNNIHISGGISDPKEGNNVIRLKASVPGEVTHGFKSDTRVVNLEKIVKEKRSIEVNLEGKGKKNADEIILDQDNVRVSGPRIQVNKVQKVVATLDIGNETNDFARELDLIPVDENGDKVKDVDLDLAKIGVNVTLLKQKTVPINVVFSDNSQVEDNLKDYEISQKTINIKGKKDIVDKIDTINTKPLDLSSITENISKDIYLDIPEGINVDHKYITIKLDAVKSINTDLTYTSEEIQLRNLSDSLDISKFKIPDNVKVTVEHSDNINAPTKSDIVLYIDFSESPNEEGVYSIKYETNYEVKQIKIEPNITSVI